MSNAVITSVELEHKSALCITSFPFFFPLLFCSSSAHFGVWVGLLKLGLHYMVEEKETGYCIKAYKTLRQGSGVTEDVNIRAKGKAHKHDYTNKAYIRTKKHELSRASN